MAAPVSQLAVKPYNQTAYPPLFAFFIFKGIDSDKSAVAHIGPVADSNRLFPPPSVGWTAIIRTGQNLST